MRTICRTVMCSLLASQAFAAWPGTNLAVEAMSGPEEEEANRVMWSIKPHEPAEKVRQQVKEFLASYPGTRRRREVRLRLVQSAVLTDRTADAVEECMRQSFDLTDNVLGDQVVRDSWVQLASLLEGRGRFDGAARMRLRICLRFPYQVENRQQLALAVMDLAKAGLHEQVLATGKLALAVLPEGESAAVIETVKQSLGKVRGAEVTRQFGAHWQYGPAGPDGRKGTSDDCTDPLQDVAVPEREVLRRMARSALATKGLLSGAPDVAAMQKGLLLLFAGDASLAAQELQNAVNLANPDQREAVADMAGIYFRWTDGSAARSRQYRAFARYGKAGSDGAAGTGDDLVNPLLDAVTASSH